MAKKENQSEMDLKKLQEIDNKILDILKERNDIKNDNNNYIYISTVNGVSAKGGILGENKYVLNLIISSFIDENLKNIIFSAVLLSLKREEKDKNEFLKKLFS